MFIWYLLLLLQELDEKNVECQQLASKVGSAESKLYDAERRVEALATLQSHRWMEFSKMADNMKELSHNMLTQSKTNTRKAAIRADLDEELEMWKQFIIYFLYILTPPNFRVCTQRKVPAKRFKICHILFIRKPKVAFYIFHFLLLYIFTKWMPCHIDQGIH